MPTTTKTLVRAPSAMDSETFRLHMNHRHGQDIPKQGFAGDPEQPYRALHRRAHHLEEFDHEHSPEPQEAAIEYTLRCLQENHLWGWREIAGTKGVVSAFPDGSFGVRFGNGRVQYYNQIDRVALMLLKGKFLR